jgi:hypothetical protein
MSFYKFILNHQRISEKGGGGLGLVYCKKNSNKLKLHLNNIIIITLFSTWIFYRPG